MSNPDKTVVSPYASINVDLPDCYPTKVVWGKRHKCDTEQVKEMAICPPSHMWVHSYEYNLTVLFLIKRHTMSLHKYQYGISIEWCFVFPPGWWILQGGYFLGKGAHWWDNVYQHQIQVARFSKGQWCKNVVTVENNCVVPLDIIMNVSNQVHRELKHASREVSFNIIILLWKLYIHPLDMNNDTFTTLDSDVCDCIWHIIPVWCIGVGILTPAWWKWRDHRR